MYPVGTGQNFICHWHHSTRSSSDIPSLFGLSLYCHRHIMKTAKHKMKFIIRCCISVENIKCCKLCKWVWLCNRWGPRDGSAWERNVRQADVVWHRAIGVLGVSPRRLSDRHVDFHQVWAKSMAQLTDIDLHYSNHSDQGESSLPHGTAAVIQNSASLEVLSPDS